MPCAINSIIGRLQVAFDDKWRRAERKEVLLTSIKYGEKSVLLASRDAAIKAARFWAFEMKCARAIEARKYIMKCDVAAKRKAALKEACANEAVSSRDNHRRATI